MVKAKNVDVNYHKIYTEKTNNLFDLEKKKADNDGPAGYTRIAVERTIKDRAGDLYKVAGPETTNKQKDCTFDKETVDKKSAMLFTKTSYYLRKSSLQALYFAKFDHSRSKSFEI